LHFNANSRPFSASPAQIPAFHAQAFRLFMRRHP
jgi:hypothetical protein